MSAFWYGIYAWNVCDGWYIVGLDWWGPEMLGGVSVEELIEVAVCAWVF